MMVRISNFIVGILNCCSLLIGLAAMVASLYFYLHGGTQCQKVLQTPLLVTGIFLFAVSLLGLIGSFCRVNTLLIAYLIVMFLLIIGLLVFTIFAFMVTNQNAGQVMSYTQVIDKSNHKLLDFSHWLENYFVNGKNWNEIRSCLRDSQICNSLNDSSVTASDFYQKNLSPIQSGCCKPPSECGFEYKNATFWIPPAPESKPGPAVDNSDCDTWNNQVEKLCYDCNSCRGGVLRNIKKEWRHLAIFNLCALIITIVTYSFGCCARRNNKKDNSLSP